MVAHAKKGARRKGGKITAWVWGVLLVVLIGAGVLALNVTQRFRRVAQETNQLRNVVAEASKQEDMIIKTPARKEFSAAFLQMAFGDNPVLLDQVKEALSHAVGKDTRLSQGDIAMMLTTYRAEGELRDVAIHVFGNLDPSRLPHFSSDGYWRGQLTDEFYGIGQSMLGLLGREVLILANKEVKKRQEDLLTNALNGEYPMVSDYLHDPISFIAVIPDPTKLFPEQYRPYIAAVLVKGKISVDNARTEVIALSYDPQKARELAQMFSDMRMMAMGLARVRGGGFQQGIVETGVDSLSKMQVQADGPTVTATTMIPKELLDQVLPRLTQGLARGTGRIKRGPGFPK